MSRRIVQGLAGIGLLLATGCASTPDSAAPATAPGGVAYRDDQDLQKVWVADGFDFTGFDTLYVVAPRVEVPKVNPDGVENLEWARGLLPEELASAIRGRQVFTSVVTREADIRPGSRTLRLETTIVEYEKGGGGARWFGSLYGAGQPVIRVRGRLSAEDRPVFLFESRRSGESGGARWLGGYRSDKDIQQEDIRDLAVDLADFMARKGKSR
jgi:hypothetical protein